MRVIHLLICLSFVSAVACVDDETPPTESLDSGVDAGGDGGGEAGPLDGGGVLLDASDASVSDATVPPIVTVLELGHVRSVSDVRVSGDRVVSMDVGGRWVLWELVTRRLLASGQAFVRPAEERPYPPTLRGDTLAIQVADGLELRDARDGRLLSKLRAPAENLASDGSYVWKSEGNRLLAYLRTGELALDTASNDALSSAVAVPGELRAAFADASGIMRYEVGPGRMNNRFVYCAGTFRTWFADGSHFLVEAFDEDRKPYIGVCDVEGKLVRKFERRAELTPMGGFGNFVWFEQRGLDTTVVSIDTVIYRLDGDEVTRKNGRAGVMQPDGVLETQWGYVDLGRPREAYFDQGSFSVQKQSLLAFSEILGAACDAAPGGWCVLTTGAQVQLVRTDNYRIEDWNFGTGPVTAVVGSENGRLAVSTADGNTRVYALGDGASLLTWLPGIATVMSADGTTLLVSLPRGRWKTVRLPTGETLHDWLEPEQQWLTMSRDGSRVLRSVYSYVGKTRWYDWFMTSADGLQTLPVPLPTNATALAPLLSVTGLRVADPLHGGLYEAGQTTVTVGKPLGWLTDEHLLTSQPVGDGGAMSQDVVVDPRGTVLQVGRPDRARDRVSTVITPIDATRFFDASRFWLDGVERLEAGVYRRSDLTSVWTPSLPVTGPAAPAGDHIVYTHGARLVAESWQ